MPPLLASIVLLSVLFGLATHIHVEAFEAEERLIGWKGEVEGSSNASKLAYDGLPFIETIAWAPRAFLYHNFLTHAECDHLVHKGENKVRPSLVVDATTGGSKSDSIRTSYGAAFARGEDPVIAGIEHRIAEWTHVPPSHGEALQVLRYMNGQKYDAHWDWFDDVHHKQGPGMDNRYATVLLYLSEVEEGGETTLPLASAIDEEAQSLANASKCASKMGIAIKPQKGAALLFFDMDIAGTKGDRRALHASCPTLRGTKWTATKWIHNHPQGTYNSLERAGMCSDLDMNCAAKAAKDGCSQPGMMGLAGRCRRTCKDCRVCELNDIICYRSNMRSKADAITTD